MRTWIVEIMIIVAFLIGWGILWYYLDPTITEGNIAREDTKWDRLVQEYKRTSN